MIVLYIGPYKSKFGKWLKNHGISHVELSKKSGVPRTTIGNLAREENRCPTRLTGQKLIKAIREIEPKVKESDFWNI